jgi:hypothetical protein
LRATRAGTCNGDGEKKRKEEEDREKIKGMIIEYGVKRAGGEERGPMNFLALSW